MQLQLIAALIIIFLIVIFAVQNAVSVSVVFFLWRIDASLAVVQAKQATFLATVELFKVLAGDWKVQFVSSN